MGCAKRRFNLDLNLKPCTSTGTSTQPLALQNYPGGFAGYLGEPSQAAAGGRPLAVAAEVGRGGGEGGHTP